MKPRRGCESCRQRHRKCVIDLGASICNECRQSGLSCVREPRYRFSHARNGSFLEHDRGQTWSSPPTSITFVPEERVHNRAVTTAKEGISPTATSTTTNNHGWGPEFPQNNGRSTNAGYDPPTLSGIQKLSETVVLPPPEHHNIATDGLNSAHHSGVESCDTHSPDRRSNGIRLIPPANCESEQLQTLTTALPSEIPSSAGFNTDTPLASRTSPSPLTPLLGSGHRSDHCILSEEETYYSALLNQRQAYLFRIYEQKLAPRSDACDGSRHFAVEVPRLALREPIIMNGVLALASRYDAILNNRESDLEGTYYHNRCIELLIKAFAQAPETYDSVLLTAVVISRLYEELDQDTDSHYHHLRGTWNLLNHNAVARFVSEGGLAEAASWLHLRQAIYVILVRKEPVKICLSNFERSTAFKRTDNGAYANRMVYLFVKILKLFIPTVREDVGGSTSPGLQGDEKTRRLWQDLEKEVRDWMRETPMSFRPLYYEPADADVGRPFPTIWLMASEPAIGLQYYHAGVIIFNLQQCNHISPNSGFQAAKLRRNNERTIASHLCTLMGLALSNSHAENAYFLPSHVLSLCGYCIRHPVEREHTIRFLHKVTEVVQWKTRTLIDSLQRQWEELDELEGRR